MQKCTQQYGMEGAISKREQNRLQRRKAIVAIATRAFLDHGYAATSMSAIADELGGSKATLWSHFSSKEDLFTAVIDDLVARFGDDLKAILLDSDFTIEGLRRYCQRFLAKVLSEDGVALFRLIVAEGGRSPEINAVFHIRAPVPLLNGLSAYFATRYTEEEAASLAQITNCTLAGYRSQCLTRPKMPNAAEIEQFIDDFIAHLRLPAYVTPNEGR